MNSAFWPEEHSALLYSSISLGMTYSEAAKAVNDKLGAVYSRNACIGRARRMGLSSKAEPRKAMTREEANRRKALAKKLRRWAVSPWLREAPEAKERKRKEKAQLLASNRALFLARGATKTSPGYRKQFPKQPEMSKCELRAMLTTAIENTAALEIS